MKTVVSKQLTNNDKINQYILAQFDLQDEVVHDSTLLNEIKRAFLSEEITREEMDMIFYDVYNIDTIFDEFTPNAISILAELGYLHDKIVKDVMNPDAIYAIIQQYKHLDDLIENPIDHIRSWAKQYHEGWDQARKNHSQILKLLDSLDLTLFHLREFDKNSVSVAPQSLQYAKTAFNFDVHVRVIDCGESFTIDLHYDKYYETQRQRAEQFFNEYNFKELPSLRNDHITKHGEITGLSFEEVLEFIDRESHMIY